MQPPCQMLMKMKNLLILCLLFMAVDIRAQVPATSYPDHVGDIAFDPLKDKADFHLCEPKDIYQYYNCGTSYRGEKKALKDQVFAAYKYSSQHKDVNGFVVIRFVVNCKGETDRFRITEIDTDYKSTKFPEELTNHLLNITKSLKGWIPCTTPNGEKYNSYVYLNYILKNGKLQEVGP
jgi:hypothetical protein